MGRERLLSYSQNPTSAHTGRHRISSQRMDAALQQLMSMGAVSRKTPPARTVPTLFGRQPMQTSTNRVTYHAYHAYHAPFPSAGSYGFRGHGDNKVTETAEFIQLLLKRVTSSVCQDIIGQLPGSPKTSQETPEY